MWREGRRLPGRWHLALRLALAVGVAVSTALDLTFGPALAVGAAAGAPLNLTLGLDLAVGAAVGAPLDGVVFVSLGFSLGFYVKIPGFYVGINILDVVH